MARTSYKHKPRARAQKTAMVLQRAPVIDHDALRGDDTSVSRMCIQMNSAASAVLFIRLYIEDQRIIERVFNPILTLPYDVIHAIRYVNTIMKSSGMVCEFTASMRPLNEGKQNQMRSLIFSFNRQCKISQEARTATHG